LLYIQEVLRYTEIWKNFIGGQIWRKKVSKYVAKYSVLVGEGRISKASEASATTPNSRMEVEEYHYGFCIGIT